MKARTRDNGVHVKSGSTRSLSAPGADVRSTRKEVQGTHSVATWKCYAESRLRQFCVR